jgi:predicted metal-dependent phosphoesterase TrpH
MKRFTIFAVILLWSASVFAHGRAGTPPTNEARRITFPDTEAYQVLVVDPHTHSVFSDGHVWPRVRVEEALRDGLDAVAITEHLEYQPHLSDIPHPDRNRAYKDAASAAEDHDLMVIAGAEITRGNPAGHQNALFLTDANKLLRVSDPFEPKGYGSRAKEWPTQEAVKAANEQGAFVFSNHGWWRRAFPNGIIVSS